MADEFDRDVTPGVGSSRHAHDGSLRSLDRVDAADDLLDRLATAVRARVRARQAAELRLGSFVFREGPEGARPAPTAVPDAASVDWRFFVLRALAVVGDPDAVRFLEAVRSDGLPLDDLMSVVEPQIADRLVAGDLVGGLASAGLVGRDLESDRVSLLPLGEAILDLVAELERRAAAGQP